MRIGLEHHIVTPYTSFVAVDDAKSPGASGNHSTSGNHSVSSASDVEPESGENDSYPIRGPGDMRFYNYFPRYPAAASFGSHGRFPNGEEYETRCWRGLESSTPSKSKPKSRSMPIATSSLKLANLDEELRRLVQGGAIAGDGKVQNGKVAVTIRFVAKPSPSCINELRSLGLHVDRIVGLLVFCRVPPNILKRLIDRPEIVEIVSVHG